MSWLGDLVRTYENNEGSIGQYAKNRNGREYTMIPVSHTTQSAHIEVRLSSDGDFRGASVVSKDDASTVIPCTEKSANRTSAPEPYPLCDKLVYVAGDYDRYCGQPKGTPHADYLRNLRAWCESPDGHSKVQSVLAYLSQGRLMADLVRDHILWLDESGRLLQTWPSSKKEKPPLFEVLAGDQASAFVRFAVEVPGDLEPRLWRDPSVYQSFIRYYQQTRVDEDLCYVTGEVRPYGNLHGSRIRHSGDKAKLISANDTSGFTFRGRFQTSREAAIVSYDASQKAHNALKWLIERQGKTAVDGRVFLVWGTDRLDVPDPSSGSIGLYDNDEDGEMDLAGDNTHQEFARQIRKALDGYRYASDYQSRVILMILDAATPGRMSIVYYRDLERDPFLDQLQHWHTSCAWFHRYRKNDGRWITFWGAPPTRDIAFAAYGPDATEKVVKGVLERMLPCIVDGQPVPRDIVRSTVHRASNPVSMELWQWEKTLSVACALVNKTYEQEAFRVALDEQFDSRDYLFGRLLAIADVLERSALEEKRASNAIRYMNAFARYPARTWGIIQSNIQPYQAKLGAKATYYNQLIDQVGSRIKVEDFTNQPLSGVYLLGFYSQRQALYTKREKTEHTTQDELDMTTQEE